MKLVFEKLDFNDKEKISEMSEFAGKIFFDYYDSQLPEGQASYMKEKFLSKKSIEEKLSPEHLPSVNFEFVKNEETGEKVGFLCYWMQNAKYKKTNASGETDSSEYFECYLDKYYLAEKFRGNGLGKMMMDHLKIFCSENSLPQISLNVNKYNKTVAVYEKLGFVKAADEVNDIGNNYVMDDFVMHLYV